MRDHFDFHFYLWKKVRTEIQQGEFLGKRVPQHLNTDTKPFKSIMLLMFGRQELSQWSNSRFAVCFSDSSIIHGRGQPFVVEFDEMYQTRETVFLRDIQTPRRELKIRRAAEHFWWNSICLDSRWNTVSSVWYIFSIETKTEK